MLYSNQPYCFSIKTLSAELISTQNLYLTLVFVNFEPISELSYLTKILTRPVLVTWDLTRKKPTLRLKNQGRKAWKTIRKLTKSFVIKTYFSYIRWFKHSSASSITTIFWSAILASKKLLSFKPENTITKLFGITLKLTSKVVK